MKTLYVVAGTMGVGKTTVCQILKRRLDRAVMLDGDWCWDADPFQVTDETKAMVQGNICHLLQSFLTCSAYENVVFCWVMHEQAIIDEILSRIDLTDCVVHIVALTCTPEELRRRLEADVARGLRDPDIIERSTRRLACYDVLDATHIDTTGLTPEEVAERIVAATT